MRLGVGVVLGVGVMVGVAELVGVFVLVGELEEVMVGEGVGLAGCEGVVVLGI